MTPERSQRGQEAASVVMVFERKRNKESSLDTHTATCNIDSERVTAAHPAQQPSPALGDDRAGWEGEGRVAV